MKLKLDCKMPSQIILEFAGVSFNAVATCRAIVFKVGLNCASTYRLIETSTPMVSVFKVN